MTLLYRLDDGIAAHEGERLVKVPGVDWDELFNGGSVAARVSELARSSRAAALDALAPHTLLPPIGRQEVWAAGVTYLRSRTARMEESSGAGGSSFYDRVYEAHRPELFFKATPHRVAGPGQPLTLRSDAVWSVPEPELTLAFDCRGGYVGFTIGNDLSSRDIEGENPLYLPQAKVWSRCAGLGPAIRLGDLPPAPETAIRLAIHRDGSVVFEGETKLSQMKQTFDNLREHLFRDNDFPDGCFLMTGTGIVPPDSFRLSSGDRVSITVDAVGTLENPIA